MKSVINLLFFSHNNKSSHGKMCSFLPTSYSSIKSNCKSYTEMASFSVITMHIGRYARIYTSKRPNTIPL